MIQPLRVHAPYDRYTAAFVELGIPFLSEVEWATAVNRHRWHHHQEIQILWILEGTLGLEMADQKIESAAGTCYRLPAGLVHRVVQRPDHPRVVFLDMRLWQDEHSPLARFLDALGSQIVFRAAVEPLRAGAAELRGALALAGIRRTARVQAVVWQMLEAMIAGSVEAGPAGGADTDPRLRIVESVMREHVGQPPEVEQLAAAAGLSRSQLTRLFKACRGVGPAERFRQIRVDKGRELLATSTLSIKEVAHVCGFVCPNHFCRVFLRLAGLTPGDYRRRHSKLKAGRRRQR